MAGIEEAEFRRVLGHVATGVVVVTAMTDEGPAGFTCQSFGSLSLEPQLVSFSATSTGASWTRMKDCAVMAVSVLAHDQVEVARRFATTGVDKFSSVSWSAEDQGPPRLEGALAHIEGRVVSRTPLGDHDLCVLEVTRVHSAPGTPLLFYRGAFHGLA